MTCRPRVIASVAVAIPSWPIIVADARGGPAGGGGGSILQAELLPGGGVMTTGPEISAAGDHGGSSLSSALLEKTSELNSFEVWADSSADPHRDNASALEKKTEDCRWSVWSPWSSCSRSCGLGSTVRSRGKVGPFNGGAECDGLARESNNCSPQPCPIDCVLGEWEPWSECSVSCGGPNAPGKTQRTRKELRKAAHQGKDCEEKTLEMRVCKHLFHESCPTDCRWGDWGSFGACSVTCGVAGGVRVRFREIAQQLIHTGKQCEGEYYETEECGKAPCAMDCKWDEWQEWSTCTTECGEGQKLRVRDMLSKASETGKCPGSGVEQALCLTRECAEDCHFGDWGDWSSCSTLCGGGERTKERLRSPEKHGGQPCLPGEEDVAKEPCGMEECT